MHLNSNRAPSLALAVDWAPLKGPGRALVTLGASDGGPPELAGTFSERYEKPIPTPEGMASAERRRVRVVSGTFEWEAIAASSADGKRRVSVQCAGHELAFQPSP